jgi:hypothetical protein
MTGLSILYNGTGHSIGASYPPDSTLTPTAASLLGIDGVPGITTYPTQVSEYGGHSASSVPGPKVSSVTSSKTEPVNNEDDRDKADQHHKGSQEEEKKRNNEDGPVSQDDKGHPLGNAAVSVVLTVRTLQVCRTCLREPRWGVCTDCGVTAACLWQSYSNL